jgi:hypothetical protein
MSVFSKLTREPDKPIPIPITWKDENVNMQRIKLDELKRIAKTNGLYVSGTKDVLIARITAFFKKVRITVRMQTIYRGNYVRKIFKSRGIGLIQRSKCVNDTDFFTLDSIYDVGIYDFFSYTDVAGFTYGFDLNSLNLLLRKQGYITNPYTREKMDGKMLATIISLFRHQPLGEMPEGGAISILERMRLVRIKPHQTRIRELFYEIDNLGNYTDSVWFSQLTRYELVGLLRNMYEIWSYRANMSTITKMNICPHFNPFQDGVMYFSENINRVNTEELIMDCLTIMENMIYTGIDEEYRKLGALHVLSALTLVSIPAKNSMPWLYDSLVF